MQSKYVEALEKRARWAAWARTKAWSLWNHMDRLRGPADRHGEPFTAVLPAYEESLAKGDTVFMNRAFCDLVDHAKGVYT